MTVVVPTVTNLGITFDGVQGISVTWVGLTGSDTGEPVQVTGLNDRCAQVFGTFGSGALSIQGSNDQVNFATINNTFAQPLRYTASAILNCTESPRWIRPAMTTASAAASLTVVLICTRPANG